MFGVNRPTDNRSRTLSLGEFLPETAPASALKALQIIPREACLAPMPFWRVSRDWRLCRLTGPASGRKMRLWTDERYPSPRLTTYALSRVRGYGRAGASVLRRSLLSRLQGIDTVLI